jgi:DNA-binding NarL/FixJ family response regulator
MRIILVGGPEQRAHWRRKLAGSGFEVVDEFGSFAEASSSRTAHDAILLPSGADGREFDEDSGFQDDGVVQALTARELDVLKLLATGMTNKTIAARLAISDQTVKFHVAEILGKLGAANRTSAVRRALRKGLIPI